MKVVLCVPTIGGPTAPFVEAIGASIPALDEAGLDHHAVEERNCPYISQARSTMLRKALDAKADVIVFLDYDLSWDPQDLVKLIRMPGMVVAGTYRFKQGEEKYMGRLFQTDEGRPIVNENDCVRAEWIPAGFMKITAEAVDFFMRSYPELVYGPAFSPLVDLFNHGVHEGVWWGEDYAFSRRWNEAGGEIWTIPDLNLVHHAQQKDGTFKAYPGNYHQFLLKQKPKKLELVEAA